MDSLYGCIGFWLDVQFWGFFPFLIKVFVVNNYLCFHNVYKSLFVLVCMEKVWVIKIGRAHV